MESNISAPVLLNLLHRSEKKRDKMLDRPRILSLFLNSLNKFNKTLALMSYITGRRSSGRFRIGSYDLFQLFSRVCREDFPRPAGL